MFSFQSSYTSSLSPGAEDGSHSAKVASCEIKPAHFGSNSQPAWENGALTLEASIGSTKAGWRAAWRTILKQQAVKARFHDLRHIAVTTMAEAGLPDLTIMAQVGHVSPADDETLFTHHTTGFESGHCSAAAKLSNTEL